MITKYNGAFEVNIKYLAMNPAVSGKPANDKNNIDKHIANKVFV